MLLSIKQTINPNQKEKIILDSLSYSAYKLWNVANYEKRNYKSLGFSSFPDWYEQKKRMKSDFWFKNLPSQTAQEVLNTLQQAWKSFFKLQQTQGVKNPQPPRFKYCGCGFKYLNNGFKKLDDGRLRFAIPKQLKLYLQGKHDISDAYFFLKTKRFSNISNIKQIMFAPLKEGRYEVILIYEVADVQRLANNNNFLSIDIGVSNLLTCYDNKGKSFIISGNKYLNACYYYNKKIAHYQAISDAQQRAKGVKYPRKSKRVLRLYKRRNGAINDAIHKATRFIANYCKDNSINTVIIGDITNIRNSNSLGKKANQVFHALPFKKIYDQLSYKLSMYGINSVKQNEAYSSQCSPDSADVSKKHAQKSNRKHRGLYVSSNTIYNADCVGAYNILRLYNQRAKLGISHPLINLSNPLKVSV